MSPGTRRDGPRKAALASGVAVLVLAWAWLPTLALPPFTAHMTMHMAVVALATPLLAVGVAGGPLDPVRATPAWWTAIPASVAELVGVWAWHAPALHDAARAGGMAMVLEQATFVLTGFALWSAALGGDAPLRRSRAVGGVTALLLTSMHMTLLGALLLLAGRPLYAHHAHHVATTLSPALDQQLGGAVMLLAGGAAYLLGGVLLIGDALRADARARVPP